MLLILTLQGKYQSSDFKINGTIGSKSDGSQLLYT